MVGPAQRVRRRETLALRRLEDRKALQAGDRLRVLAGLARAPLLVVRYEAVGIDDGGAALTLRTRAGAIRPRVLLVSATFQPVRWPAFDRPSRGSLGRLLFAEADILHVEAQRRGDARADHVLVHQVVHRLVVSEHERRVLVTIVRIWLVDSLRSALSTLAAALSIKASTSGFEYFTVLIGPPDLRTSE